VPLVKTRALGASLLGSSASLGVDHGYNGRLTITGLPNKPPHGSINVVKVEFAEEPRSITEEDHAAWLKGKAGA
jgi:hypothetical protein